MNIEQRLSQVAAGYRAQGYKVVVRPGPDDLPDFAKDFKVEILASRDDGCVLASAKKNQSDLEADPNVVRYAEVTNEQRGWRFDVFVLGSETQPMPDNRESKEPAENDIRCALDEVERMLQAGFVQPSLIAAWAALEAAMRRRLQTDGKEAGWGTSSRTMLNELYSDGVLHGSAFRNLEGLFQARSAIVHGFTTPVIDKGAVQFLVETTRRLVTESQASKKTA